MSLSRRQYRARAARAYKQMTPEEVAALDALLGARLPIEEATALLGMTEAEIMAHGARAFGILRRELEKPVRPWWRWR